MFSAWEGETERVSRLPKEYKEGLFNPLHPNINIHILHTVLYTFTKVLTRRICLTITDEFLQLVIISFIHMTLMCRSVVIL